MDKMSDSMPEILKIYDGKYRGIYWDIDKDSKIFYWFSKLKTLTNMLKLNNKIDWKS